MKTEQPIYPLLTEVIPGTETPGGLACFITYGTRDLGRYRLHRATNRRRSRQGRPPRVATNTRARGSRRAAKAAAARSPGGGDDDPGDPDPADPAQGQPGESDKGRHCRGCGHSLDDLRPQARYCNNACRMAYNRSGKAAEPVVILEVPELATVLLEIDSTARRRQAAWMNRADDDPAKLTAYLAELWHQARRARAVEVAA